MRIGRAARLLRRVIVAACIGGISLAACAGSAAGPPHKSTAGSTGSRTTANPAGSTTGASGTGAPSRATGHTEAPFGHVFVVVMENESLQAALANRSVAALAHHYAYDSESYAATHPSLPNYLALSAGSTFGISSDCLGCFIRSSNLGTELTKRGVSWDAFFQGVSSRCYLGTSYGLYAAKHNPFRYFDDIRSSRRLCSHLRPYSELGPLLAGPVSAVPSFLWVTPDVCDDGHSCSEAVAGRWLAGFVAEVTRSRAWTRGGVLFATWDEGSFSDTSSITPAGRVLSSGGGGRILTLVVTPRLRAGTVLRRPLNHFGLLATIEENFSLPLLHGARAWRHHTLFKFRD